MAILLNLVKKRGITFATFRLSGKIPVDSVWLIMRVTDLQISSLHVFNEIPSYPQLGFGLRLLRIFIVVSSVISSNVKSYIVTVCFLVRPK